MSSSLPVVEVAWLREQVANWRLGLFLLLCLILGGTSQDIVSVKLPLYLTSLAMIALALTSRRRAPLSKLRKMPEVFGGLLLLLYFVYLIPLPPDLWTRLQGRQDIAEGFKIVGANLPWLPLSLSPEKTLFSIFDFLPLIAIALIFRLQASPKEKKNALLMLVFMGVLSVILGILQIISNEGLYIYKVTNVGLPVGFFSNANHQACFLAMTLSLALLVGLKPQLIFKRADEELNRFKIFGIFSALIIVIGILLSNSLAGYVFIVLTFPPTLFIIFRRRRISKYVILFVFVIFLGLLLDFTVFGGHMSELVNELSSQSALSRTEMFSLTFEAQNSLGVFGGGPGAFLEIYKGVENREIMTHYFAPQAHNDYLQLLLELGVMGAFLIIGFLIWFLTNIFKLFGSFLRGKTMACVISLSLLCPIIHSIVDYSLRTLAIMAIFYFLVLFFDELCSFKNSTFNM